MHMCDSPVMMCITRVSASTSQTTLSPSASATEGRTNNVNALKYRCEKVHELRVDIDRLRSVVTDRLAEDMGRRLTCNPQ